MPYTKNGNRPQGYYKKKYTKYKRRKGQFTYGQVLDKVVGDVAKLKGLINTEFKTVDVSSATAISSTGSVLLLNATIAGDGFNNRDGRMIRCKSIQYALNVIMEPATAVNTSTRVIVVIDTQPNGVLMTIAELLNGSNTIDFRNLDNRKRFVILTDRVVTQSATANTLNQLTWYKQIDMKTIYDDSNAGTIADIESNALLMILISSEATNTPTVQVETRMRFIDN